MHCKSIAIFVISCMTALVAAAPTPFLNPELAVAQALEAREINEFTRLHKAILPREPEAAPAPETEEIDERGCGPRTGYGCI
ncbi:hypothetical protein AAF712_009557 [Marasmius tenuissimus]|uniref:Uncharacterized protein n=1 Tax=Marasmius tenuissimus TaxID=585030 RepID=A0ABR2ZQ59_9AGAR